MRPLISVQMYTLRDLTSRDMVGTLAQLAELKSSLVRFRGQWVQVNPDQLQQALKFWKKRAEVIAPVR